MTTTRAKFLTALGLVLVGGATLVGGCSLEPAAPDLPTYDADVRPIFMSRCVRCHGDPPMADPTDTNPAYQVAPTTRFRIDVFADSADCATGGANCVLGAQSYAGIIASYLVDGSQTPMPPPPAPLLTKYQVETVRNWIAEKPAPLEK
jgi:mono/diheme cytochrome c family protein